MNKSKVRIAVNQVHPFPNWTIHYHLHDMFSLGAVQRKYESLRREVLRDTKEDKEIRAENDAKKKKYRSRRQRVRQTHSFYHYTH